MSLPPNPLSAVLPPDPNDDWRSQLTGAALLVVDMQYADAHPEHGICQDLKDRGLLEEYEYYRTRLRSIVPNIQSLLAAFRAEGMPVFHSVIRSLLPGGEDRCRRHKKIGLHVPPGSKEGEVLEELAPLAGEPVLAKTTASVFNSTTLDRVLRNIGCDTLVVAGVVTNGCIESTVRDAADLSYNVVLVEDACGALTPELHEASLRTLRHSYCTPVATWEVVEALGRKPYTLLHEQESARAPRP